MKYLKIKIVLAISALATQCVMGQDFFVKLKNETTQQIALSSIRCITYSGNTMNVNLKNGSVQSWNVFDVAYNAYQSPTSLKETTLNEKTFLLYPNPVANELKLQFEFDGSKEHTVEVCNVHGRVLLNSGKIPTNSKSLSLDVSGLPAGVYVCFLKTDNQIFTQQFIKQ